MNLSKNIKLVKVGAYNDTQNTTDIDGSDVDFTGYDGVLFFGWLEIKTASTDTNKLVVEQKSGSTYTALTGAEAEATENGMVLWVDVYRPLESQGKIVRGAYRLNTNTKKGDMYAILYNGRVLPTDLINEATNGMNGALVISPVVTT